MKKKVGAPCPGHVLVFFLLFIYPFIYLFFFREATASLMVDPLHLLLISSVNKWAYWNQ